MAMKFECQSSGLRVSLRKIDITKPVAVLLATVADASGVLAFGEEAVTTTVGAALKGTVKVTV